MAVAPLDFLARDFRAGISGPGSGAGGGEPRLERIATGPLFSSSMAAELVGVRTPSWTGCGRRPASSRSSASGLRCRGGAAGVSGTAAGIPVEAASAASRGPTRSKT